MPPRPHQRVLWRVVRVVRAVTDTERLVVIMRFMSVIGLKVLRVLRL
jgi:hypothetical protein